MRWAASRRRPSGVILKTAAEIELMRAAGRVVAKVLQALAGAVQPGVTTKELDTLAEQIIRGEGAVPSFLGVPAPMYGIPDYPAATCLSVNDEIVHGIPSDRRLQSGDIVSCDVGAILNGWHGDATMTYGVGEISPEASRLLETTQEALLQGIAKARAGGWLGDIGHAIQQYSEERGYAVVRDYTGHSIGREMHEGFLVPNFGMAHTGLRLKPGMTMAIEPMLNVGVAETKVKENGWTVVTADGKLSAHFEHTIAITESGPQILTSL